MAELATSQPSWVRWLGDSHFSHFSHLLWLGHRDCSHPPEPWLVVIPIVSRTATHMHGGPYAYASHYALSGIRKLGACTSLASPNASHYAARRTPPPSKINRKRQYIHVIIACVTVRWPCGCLIRTTCHVYGLWISAGAPRPAEGGASSTYHVSALRIRPFHRKALPGGRCNGPRGGCLRTTCHVYGAT